MKIIGQDLVEYKKILVKELSFLDNLCKNHGIKYFAVAGTAIGAVRHNGFIPWDDDIDVAMLRQDYNRFISLKDSLMDTNYRIFDYTDEGYYLPSAKLVDINTTLWEVEEQPYVMGAYIDVFPLDYVDCCDEDVLKFEKTYRKCFNDLRLSKSNIKFKSVFSLLTSGHIRGFMIKLYEKCLSYTLKNKGKDIMMKIKYLENQLLSKRGEKVLNYNHYYPLQNELLEVIWLAKTITFQFETTTVELPWEFDSYLKRMFGNYMQLPPENKRVGHHCCYYYNLQRHLDVNEILYELSKEANIKA